MRAAIFDSPDPGHHCVIVSDDNGRVSVIAHTNYTQQSDGPAPVTVALILDLPSAALLRDALGRAITCATNRAVTCAMNASADTPG